MLGPENNRTRADDDPGNTNSLLLTKHERSVLCRIIRLRTGIARAIRYKAAVSMYDTGVGLRVLLLIP